MARRSVALVMLLAAGCAPSGESISEQMDGHSKYLNTEAAVSEAINRPGGGDYEAAVRIVQQSDRAPGQKDYDIGNLMLGSCRKPSAYCKGPATATAGLARLHKVALSRGEDAAIAAGDLALWYTRGAGTALAPEPRRAACWTAVRDGKAAPSSCPAP